MPKRRSRKQKQHQRQSQKQVVNVYYSKPRRRSRKKTKREVPKPLLPIRPRDMLTNLQTSVSGPVLPPTSAIQPPVIQIQPRTLLPDDGANRQFAINLQSQLQSAIKELTDKQLLSGKQIDGLERIIRDTDLTGQEQREEIINALGRVARENLALHEQMMAEQEDAKITSAYSFQHLSDQNLESMRRGEVHNQAIEQVRQAVMDRTDQIIELINNSRENLANQLTANLKRFADQVQSQVTSIGTALGDMSQESREQTIGALNQSIARFADKTTNDTETMIGALSNQIRSLEQQMEISMPGGTPLQDSIEEIQTQLDIAKREILNDTRVRLQSFQINLADMIQRVTNQSRIMSPARPLKSKSRLPPDEFSTPSPPPLDEPVRSPVIMATPSPTVEGIDEETLRYLEGLKTAHEKLLAKNDYHVFDPLNNTWRSKYSKNKHTIVDKNGVLLAQFINNITDKRKFNQAVALFRSRYS